MILKTGLLEVSMKKRHLLPDDRLNPVILQQQIIYLKSELDKYRSKVHDYQENYHYSQLEKLKMENSKLFGELNRYKSQLEEMNHNNLSLKNMMIEKKALLEQLKNEIGHIHYTKKKQEEALTEQESIQKDLLIKNAELEKEIDMLQTKKIETENNHVNLREQYEQVQSDYQNLQLEVSNKDGTIQELKKQIEKLEQEIMNVGNTLKQVEVENKKALEENKRYQEAAAQQKYSAQQLQNQVTSLGQKLVEHQDKQMKSEIEIRDLQNANARLKEEKQQLKEDKLTLESFQIQMFDKIEGLKQEMISHKSGEMTGPTSQNTKQITENNKLYQQIQDLLSQMNEYGEKISASMSLTNQLEEHIDGLTDEIKMLKSKLSVTSNYEKTL